MKNLIFSLLLFIVALPASADSYDESLDVEFMEFFAAIYVDPMEVVDSKLTEFGSKLNITSAQQDIWNEFKQLVINQMNQKRQRIESFKTKVKTRNGKRFTTPESLALKINHLELQLIDSQQVQSTIVRLYSQLDESQKTLFDNGMRYLWLKKQMRKNR